MKVTEIAPHAYIFSFNQLEEFSPTNVYTISKEKFVYICDTFLGQSFMNQVCMYLKSKGELRDQFIVFNSHADFDHYWGNSFFKNSIIISHEKTRLAILKHGHEDLIKYRKYKQEDNIEIYPPNLTFTESISFPEDDITIFHGPGHSNDSSALHDKKNKVLFAGDNVEWPIPLISCNNLETYIKTLESYLNLPVTFVIPGHGKIVADKTLIKSNIEYLELLKMNKNILNLNNRAKKSHELNLNILKMKSKEIND
ncbi:MAG: MBL fold metallo-hydrolase [Promethearchaeota archaeon]